MNKKLLIKGAIIVNEGLEKPGSVLIEGYHIVNVFDKVVPTDILETSEIIDAEGKYLIPGIIDDQVHFREPGLTHKGEIYTEAKAAIAGGVTSFMEMPNTNPQTITQELLEDKYHIASEHSLANYSFYIGATNNNLEELLKTDPKTVCGIKIFMGSSTGNMLVDNPTTLEQIFRQSPMLIAVHCEDEATVKANTARFVEKFGDNIPISFHPIIRSDEACYLSSKMAVDLARKFDTRLHILHLSSAREMSLFSNNIPLKEKKITGEVCVHHLWFDDSDYEKYGTRIKWNPAIKSQKDKEALLEALLNDTIDVIATDHAPHTLDEKNNPYTKAPSGGPLVQHSLNVMLELRKQGKISLPKIVEKMCHAPSDMFRVHKRGYIREGYFADLALLDLNQQWKVTPENTLYKCKWSPFEGYTFTGQVTHSIVNGHLVYANGVFNESKKGKRLTFER
jgi:dihydroorotase, multifunctional complex type